MLKRTFLLAVFAVLLVLPFSGFLFFSTSYSVPLGTASSFAVLAGSTVTNTGSSTVVGSVGVYAGTSVTGFPPGVVTGGTIHQADATAQQAQTDNTAAYLSLKGQSCPATNVLTGKDLGGLTLTAGVYCFTSSAQLTGTLTLNAKGNPNALFIFQIASTLTTASGSSVVVTNGGNKCNAFWQVGSSATLGTTTAFAGSILALASITLNHGASVSGRVLAQTGAVTMDTNHVDSSMCSTGTITTSTTTPSTTSTSSSSTTSTSVNTQVSTTCVTSAISSAKFSSSSSSSTS